MTQKAEPNLILASNDRKCIFCCGAMKLNINFGYVGGPTFNRGQLGSTGGALSPQVSKRAAQPVPPLLS